MRRRHAAVTVNGDAPRSGAKPVENRGASAPVSDNAYHRCVIAPDSISSLSRLMTQIAERRMTWTAFSLLPLSLRRQVLFTVTTSDSATSNAPRPLMKRSTGVFFMTAVKFWPGRVTRFASRHWPGTGIPPYQPCGPVPTYVSFADLDLPAAWVLKPNNRTGLVFFGQSRCTDVEPICQLTETWKSDNRVIAKGEWAYTRAAPGFLVEERIGPSGVRPQISRFSSSTMRPTWSRSIWTVSAIIKAASIDPLATHASSGPGPRIGRDRQASLPR